jgi:hypothetical protein
VPGKRGDRVATLARDLVGFGLLCSLLLLPWLLLFRESSGTLIYPLSRGNMTPDFAILKVEEGIDYNLKHVIRDLGYEKPIVTSMIFMLAGLAPSFRRGARPEYTGILSVVCILGMIFVSYMGGAFDETANARYYFGFLIWTVLAVAISIAPAPGAPRFGGYSSVRAIVVVVAIVAHVAMSREDAKKRLVAHVESIDRATELAAAELEKDTYEFQNYQDVQGHVPEGDAIAVAVYEPYRFNMKRNPVYSLDLIGGMGPKPGFPVFQGPEALARYLLDNGIRWIIHVDFNKMHDLYDVSRWRRHTYLTKSFLAYEAPFMVDGMESIQKLDASRKVEYKAFSLTLVDLRTAGAPKVEEKKAKDVEDGEQPALDAVDGGN